MLCNYAHQEVAVDAGLGPEETVCPALNATLSYVEHKTSTAFNERSSLRVVEPSRNSRNYTLARCMNQP